MMDLSEYSGNSLHRISPFEAYLTSLSMSLLIEIQSSHVTLPAISLLQSWHYQVMLTVQLC